MRVIRAYQRRLSLSEKARPLTPFIHRSVVVRGEAVQHGQWMQRGERCAADPAAEVQQGGRVVVRKGEEDAWKPEIGDDAALYLLRSAK